MNQNTGTAPATLPETLIAPGSAHRLMLLEGPDVDRFLQGQVTCDIEELTPEQSLPGAACTPKGRAYALFRLVRLSPERVLVRLPEALGDRISQQLSKYLAFFKAELKPAEDWALLGIVGEERAATLCTEVPESLNNARPAGNGVLVRTAPLPDGRARFELWWNTAEGPAPEADQTSAAWQLSEIMSGLTLLNETTTEAYVPLNLNLQAYGGISFTKGCYTGQEIIARMHHLGQLKKSLFRIEAQFLDTVPVPGDRLVDDDGNALGEVTDSIGTGDDGAQLLGVLKHTAIGATITLADQPGAALSLQALGYEVPEQQTP
ncbi:MAG: YgfZ/GcvT domain-containing protein [Pseudomonadota bacterium]